MRVRSLLAIALLVLPTLPSVADAQRLPRVPRIMDRGPTRPAPLPPQARPLAREMYYARLPYTIESYPFVSYFSAPGLGSRLGSFTSGGFGERLDLKVARTVSLTLDLTQSFIGGPAVTQTLELGTRIRPAHDAERKWYPFFDLRGGLMLMSEREARPYDYVSGTSSYMQLTHGFGGVAGTGIEYALHPRFTLTTAGSIFQTTMSPLFSDSRQLDRQSLTAVRYSIGLRYNPGRWTMPPNLPQQISQ